MKTRMFVAEVFWLFAGMYAYPQLPEQTSGTSQNTDQPMSHPTSASQAQGWYLPRSVRPPP
jgi:hypothetical protein